MDQICPLLKTQVCTVNWLSRYKRQAGQRVVRAIKPLPRSFHFGKHYVPRKQTKMARVGGQESNLHEGMHSSFITAITWKQPGCFIYGGTGAIKGAGAHSMERYGHKERQVCELRDIETWEDRQKTNISKKQSEISH